MEIRIGECDHSDGGLLRDLAKYRNLVHWLEAFRDDETEFYPLDCSIAIEGKNKSYDVIRWGYKEDIDAVIRAVKKVPAVRRNFPNDTAEIIADEFERELFFKI